MYFEKNDADHRRDCATSSVSLEFKSIIDDDFTWPLFLRQTDIRLGDQGCKLHGKLTFNLFFHTISQIY